MTDTTLDPGQAAAPAPGTMAPAIELKGISKAFGPVQASSRSYLARSISPEESGRYFGLYAFAGRATSFLAPASVAAITAMSGSARLGMAVIILFFIVGLIFFCLKSVSLLNKIGNFQKPAYD